MITSLRFYQDRLCSGLSGSTLQLVLVPFAAATVGDTAAAHRSNSEIGPDQQPAIEAVAATGTAGTAVDVVVAVGVEHSRGSRTKQSVAVAASGAVVAIAIVAD